MAGPRATVRLLAVLVLLGTMALSPRTLVDAESSAAERLPTRPVAAPVRFEAADGTAITVPSGRYQGAIEVLPPGGRANELTVVNDLSFDDYVAGLAEMPASWPMEALRAQAVAARTYGWFEHAQGRFRGRGYDVCATTACQVFRGLSVVEGEDGDRWRQAVRDTSGQVLLHDGAPILARYFSTSGGRRWANHVIFPSSGPRPYLVGGLDPDDEVSPLHRWEARFSAGQFQELLARGGTIGAATPYARVHTVPSTTPGLTRHVRVVGRDGTAVEVGAVAFRSFVSDVAPELWPGQYPGPRLDAPGDLPATMPSSRFEFDVRDGEDVVIRGSGWGHGVGMGQYGAKGKAERGLDHAEILAAYYNGLRPVTAPALPASIRVGVDTTAAPLEVVLDGPARLLVGGALVTERALGTWRIEPRGDGTVLLQPPVGFGLPLEVAPTTTSRATPTEVEVVRISTSVNKTVELAMVVRDASTGAVLHHRDLGVVPAGEHEVAWSLDDAEGRNLPTDPYDVVLEASGEEGIPTGASTRVAIRDFGQPGQRPLPPTVALPAQATARDLPHVVPFAVAAAAGALAGLALGVARTRRRPSILPHA